MSRVTHSEPGLPMQKPRGSGTGVNFEFEDDGLLKMVYAFLIHSLTPGPCRVLYSMPFVHKPPVRKFSYWVNFVSF